MAKHRGQTLRLTGQIIDLVEPGRLPQPLLPTPVTTDASGTRNATANRTNLNSKHHAGVTLTDALLPTPTLQDGANNGGPSQFERNTKPLNTQVLVGAEWGQYADAIQRWEDVTGRKAPQPTRPDGQNGQHRLNPVFVEWMMGLEEGHVTSPQIGLTRNNQLKACGNGVVPAQAKLALQLLLGEERIREYREEV